MTESPPLIASLETGEEGPPRLLSPGVGVFRSRLAAGDIVATEQRLGLLVSLGRHHLVHAPAMAAPSRIVERLAAGAVGYGDPLLALEALAAGGAEVAPIAETRAEASELVLRAAHSGRFYHRPGPGADVFLQAGDRIERGRTAGLLEVMKTFTPVAYGGADLPSPATVVRYLVDDGAEVQEGDALLEVSAA